MADAETVYQNRLMIALSKVGFTVFRNHVGKVQDKRTDRWHTFGLAPGSSDIVGWFSVDVEHRHHNCTCDYFHDTPPVAIFIAIECKMPGNPLSLDQGNFLHAVNDAGGFGMVATAPSHDDCDQQAQEIRSECLKRYGLL